MKTYKVNEIFYSLQGEGVRAGTASLFLRFSDCNQQCTADTHGFDCDTASASGRSLQPAEIIRELREADADCNWVTLTGGEPALQVDRDLIDTLHDAGFKLAIETNGTIELPDGLDWITVSPKLPGHAIRQRTANEVKYVRAYGQELPQTVVEADYRLISPAFTGSRPDPKALRWCIQLVQKNPTWRLTLQMHKLWAIR
jgi:organic radical activating enzyme